jgi:hypothetical protein
MKAIHTFITLLIGALVFCSCSSIELYDPHGAEASTRRLIWNSSWSIVDSPAKQTGPGPRIKNIEIINASDKDALIDFLPWWEIERIALSPITALWQGEQPEMFIPAGESLLIHVHEPAFFREGAFVDFAHRMSASEIEASEFPEITEALHVEQTPYIRSHFRRLMGSEIAGEGILRVEMGSDPNRSQQVNSGDTQ